MLFSLRLFMKTAAILAVALTCICQAQVRNSEDDLKKAAMGGHYDQIPVLSCQQFEELFPEAIKYPKQAYYTLRINGSQVVCLYDRHENIVMAFILSQAKRNLHKLEDILHLHYNEQFTEEDKSYHKAFLYHKYHLFRDYNKIHDRLSPESGNKTDKDEDDKLIFSTVIGIAGLLDAASEQRHLPGHPQRTPLSEIYRFQGWGRQGITFGRGKKTQVLFSTHDVQQPIVHIGGTLSSVFPVGAYFPDSREISPRLFTSALRQSKLKRLSNIDVKLHTVIGYDVNGLVIMGVPNRKQGLHQIPSCPPQPFPKVRSEWPSNATIAAINEELTLNLSPASSTKTSQHTDTTATAAAEPASHKRPHIPTASDLMATNNVQIHNTQVRKGRADVSIPYHHTVNIPLTPDNALETYLNNLRNMAK